MESEVRQHSRPKRRGSLLAAAALLLLVGALAASLFLSHRWKMNLKVERILVEGSRIVPAAEIVEFSGVKAGALLYGVNLHAVQKNILKQLYIQSAVVMREPPHELRIRVRERLPIAAVVQKQMIYLDAEGVALPPYPSQTMFDVPLITGIDDLNGISLGQRLNNARALYALALLGRAYAIDAELYHLISEVHVSTGGDVIVYSSDAGVPILLGKDPDLKKFLLLKTFWREFVHHKGAEMLHLVDLRFEGQIVARWKPSTPSSTRSEKL